jgi:DNA (cytosine-5)-methyltransferase 1
MTFDCPVCHLPKVAGVYSGEGGADRGLIDAGYCVTAVDSDPNRLKYSPAQHKVQGDAIEFILERGHEFLWLWNSPTCTGYSRGTAAIPDRVSKYDRLIAATREALLTTGRPYVIENVEDAGPELIDPIMLCGRMFGLTALDADGEKLTLDRHRLFESSVLLLPLGHPVHGDEQVAGVYGGGRRAKVPKGTPHAVCAPLDRYAAKHVRKGGYVPRSKRVLEDLLGIDWMTVKGLQLSIPPVYAEFIGRQLIGVL